MIGYIVVQHYHYDSTEQVEDPSTVYLDRDEALAEAEKYNASGVSGCVWEIKLPNAADVGVAYVGTFLT